jgi:hypothetical protein
MKARRSSPSRRQSPQSRYFRNDTESGLARKRHQEEAGYTGGLVEIPGPLSSALKEEIRNVAARLEREERRRRPHAGFLSITAFAKGLAIETRSEKLAQRIADALRRSRHARVERTFDDEGRRRILTCSLPEARPGGARREG